MLQKVTEYNGDNLTLHLRPCPFCGKDVAIFSDCQEVECCESFEKCPSARYKTVVCSFRNGGCGTATGFHPTYREAASAWNRRS